MIIYIWGLSFLMITFLLGYLIGDIQAREEMREKFEKWLNQELKEKEWKYENIK